jgi:hypothetical protein
VHIIRIAAIVAAVALMGCTKQEQAPQTGASQAEQVAEAAPQIINGEPPKCSDPAVVAHVRRQFLEAAVFPEAEGFLAIQGMLDGDLRATLPAQLQQRMPAALATVSASAVVSDGYTEARKLRQCAATLSIEPSMGDSVSARYSLQLTEAGDDTVINSEFAWASGKDGRIQNALAARAVVGVMFASEIAAKTAAAAQAKAEQAAALAASDKARQDEAAKLAADKKSAEEAALEEARATFK